MQNPLTQLPVPAPSQTPQPGTPTPKSRRRRWLKILVGLFVLLLFLVGAVPTIVAKTGLRNVIARRVATDLNGTLDIGSASLGWFSPIELRDLSLTDPQGRVIAQVPKVTSSKSLVSLLCNRSSLGEFTLERPHVDVVCESNSTNLEEVLRKLLHDDGSPRGPTRPEVTVRVVAGTLALRDGEKGMAGEFRDLEATIHCPPLRSDPVAVKLAANAPGKLDADIVAGDSGRVKLTTSGLAMESLAPLIRRAEPNLSLAGSLTADLTVCWTKDSATIDGKLSGQNLAIAGPWLSGDTLRFASADLPLKLTVSGRAVRVEHAELTTDIGSLAMAGTFDPVESFEKLLERPGAKLDATIHLAKLAATLPKLLRIRGGTEIREGTLVAKLESRATAEGTSWAGKINTSALKAVRDGREVKWDEPLSVEFAGRYSAGHMPVFDKLVCLSEFMAIQAEVKPDSIRAAANIYLDRLASRLAEFVDLGGATLDGRGNAAIVVQRSPDGSFKADAHLDIKQFAFIDRDGKGLREPQLTIHCSGSGKSPDGGPVSVVTANADLIAGKDELHLTLLEPIADAKQIASGRLDAKLDGDLGRWWSRVGMFVKLPKHYVLGGNATARGTVRFATHLIAIDRLSLNLASARFRGAGLDLDEQQMDAVADLTIDRKSGTTTFDKFTINSKPLSVASGRLSIQVPEKGDVVVEGGGPAVVALARLGPTLRLVADARTPESLIRGRGTGPIRFRTAGGSTIFGGTLDFVNFSFGSATAPDWTEASLRLEADGSYTESTDTLAFSVAKVERPGLEIDGTVSFAHFDSTADLNLTGKLTYDFAKLTPKLRELLGGDFAGQGKGSTPISLVGSLAPPVKPGSKNPPGALAAMNGELRVGWDSLHAYGFDVGRGELHSKLSDGICRVNPIAATFGGGKVSVQPTLFLDVEPSAVSFAKGKIVERAKLTPAVCADALGYALPAIAKTGKAEGEISINLDENRIPFSDTNKARVKGQIVIHKAAVAPGPVISEIAKLLGANNVAMTIANETVVPIRVENGSVHHQNFAVQVAGQTVVTSGSVGFDGKLHLIADVPIPAGLLKSSPLAMKALAGKRVQVPISGTLSKPALDPKLFQTAVAKLAQEAAKDVGKELLNKELEKLFPGMPGPKK
jgi:translocation and assembly module TamB